MIGCSASAIYGLLFSGVESGAGFDCGAAALVSAFRERLLGIFSFLVVGVAADFGAASAVFVFSGDGLNAIFASSGENGKEVGTGGPLEAGTLSDADAPVPFGERSIKEIFLTAGGSLFD